MNKFRTLEDIGFSKWTKEYQTLFMMARANHNDGSSIADEVSNNINYHDVYKLTNDINAVY